MINVNYNDDYCFNEFNIKSINIITFELLLY
jgi:hypothetical protein